MAQPTPYDRQSSFSNIQAQAPSDPLPGNTLDAEFNAVKETLDETLANLALIQRDDGALANGSVGLDQLSSEIEVGWQAPEVWVTATAYVSGDTVFNGAGFYRLLVAHTAGTFATDLAAGKWELIVDLSALTIVDADQIANTPAGSIAATTVQAAIDELASEKAASSHTHPSSAISDGTAAGRALLTAANAAAQRTALGLGDLALEDTVPVTEIDAEIAFSGIIEPAALGASVNDWTPTGVATCSTIRVSASTTGVEITGLSAGATDGELKIIENVGTTNSVTLPPSSASSAAANRFLIPKPIVIGPNSSVVLRYDADATTPRWRLFDNYGNFDRGHLFGLTLSNGTDATNDINIAAGEARGERNILDLVLTTAMGKQLDADWAAGGTTSVPLGGRYTTAITDTTYHVFLIGKADGTTDVFFYAASTDPTSVLPTGYIDYRRIGSIMRVSSAIRLFNQYNDEFEFVTPTLDINTNSLSTSALDFALPTPLGLRLLTRLNIAVSHASNYPTVYLRPNEATVTDAAPSVAVAPGATLRGMVPGVPTAGQATVRTNLSAKITARSDNSSTFLLGCVLSYRDTRGKDN